MQGCSVKFPSWVKQMCGNYVEVKVEQQTAVVVVSVLNAIEPFISIRLTEFCQEPQWFGYTLNSEMSWHLSSTCSSP